MIDDIHKGMKASAYAPSNDVKEATNIVKKDYVFGHGLLTRPWIELNDRSVIDDENRGQLMFNAFVDTSIEDPAEAWKWRGTRSRARAKAIAMHANLTSNFLMPSFLAQNENDEIDQDFSEVMRDIVEWMAMPNNSNYQRSFLQVTFGMMTNPVTYLGAEFFEVMQTIKERQENGKVTKKEILDEVLSGFRAPIWSSSQILLTNAYERDIQRQRAIIKRRWVDKAELEGRYGKCENWHHVRAGWNSVYSESDGLFYDIKDIQHPNLVEEVIWENRREDCQLAFVGGVFMGDENIDNNPIAHRDNRGAPKYNIVPFGYSRIGEHFFYYKSLMNILGWDNMMYDAMTEMVMNRTMLEVDMPIAISGADKIDSEIVFPKAVVAFEDKDTKISPLLPASNLSGGFRALADTERSMDQESVDPVSSGNVPDGHQQAYVLATVQANAKKIIGEVAKEVAASVTAYGDLMKDIAINHITVPEVEELTGGKLKLKYKSFLLENRQIGGRTMHKHIQFDATLIGAEMTEEEKNHESLALLEQAGWPDSKKVLMRINPEMFARFKYLSRADTEEMFTKNNEFWQLTLTNLYTLLRQDPLADTEWLLRRLGRTYFNSEGDALIKKTPQAAIPGTTGPNPLGDMAQKRALSTTLPARVQ